MNAKKSLMVLLAPVLLAGCSPGKAVEPAKKEATPLAKEPVAAVEKKAEPLRRPVVHAPPAPIKLAAPVPVKPDADGVVFMEFEEQGLPEGLEISNSVVSLDTARRIRGNQALRWDWKEGAELRFNMPVACAPERNRREDGFLKTRLFKFWIYNEVPMPGKQLQVFFGDDQGEPCSFPFNLDFTGWRTAWVSFGRDMTGKPDRDLSYLRIMAPQGIESGTFWIDDLSPSLSVDQRHQNPDRQVPFVRKASQVLDGDPHEANILVDAQVGKPNRAGTLSPNELAAFRLIEEKLKSHYPPLKGSVEALEKAAAPYGLERDESGVVRGGYLPHLGSHAHAEGFPPRLKDEINAMAGISDFRAYTELMLKMAQTYRGKTGTEAERLKALYLLMAEHLLDQGWQAGSSQGTTHHFGYASRAWPPAVFLMREELDAAGLLQPMTDSLAWNFNLKRHFMAPSVKLSNMDYLNTVSFSQLLSVAAMPDTPWKARMMKAFSGNLSASLALPSPGNQGGIKTDGSLFHHKMHYVGYGLPALSGATRAIQALDGSPYEFTPEGYAAIKRGYMAACLWGWPWSGFNACGRHPVVNDSDIIVDGTRRLALAAPGTRGADRELAASYLMMAGGDSRELFGTEIDPKRPEGAWSMNYYSGGIYRYGKTSVQFKGYGSGVRSHETYGKDNRYGRYASHGSVMVFQNTTKHSSGYVEPGWAWAHPPGTTSLIVPLDKLEGNTGFYGWRPPQSAPFAGCSDLDNRIGLFAFQLDRDGANPQPESIAMRKSVLAVDGKLICLGSALGGSADYPLVTTLFQNGLQKGNDTVLVDGTGVPLKAPLSKGWKAGGILPSWLIDPYGTGYWFAPGSQIKFTMGKQVSRDNKLKKPTEGLFAKAWIEHGVGAKDASYEYACLLEANAAAMESFGRQMASSKPYYTVERSDVATHAVHIPGQKLWALVNFEALGKPIGLFELVSQPCLVLLQQQADGALRISVDDPRLKLGGTTTAAPVDVTLRLSGRYRLSGKAEGVATKAAGPATELTVRCAEGQPTTFTLRSK